MAELHVTFLLPRFPATSETFIQAQVEGLLERGASVEIVTLAAGECGPLLERWPGRFSVHGLGVSRALLSRAPAALAALGSGAGRAAFDAGRFGTEAASLRLPATAANWPKLEPRPRVWLAHFGRWGAFGVDLRELGLIEGPIATVFHGKDMSAHLRRQPRAYARLIADGELFLPISEAWRARLLEMGAPAERTFVHRMGVDVSRFQMRLRALKPGEPVRFIGVGRMVEKKGFDDALAAFARFRAEPGAPDARLTLIGGGRLKPLLEARARGAGLGEVVRFAGTLPHKEVAAELERAHIFVLPSKTARDGDMEGVPVALMEALAMGLPALSTRHSGIPELIEHEVSGLLCAEGDRAGLADNMLALARAPERWAGMGEKGAARVRDEFDLAKWNDLLVERLAALARNSA